MLRIFQWFFRPRRRDYRIGCAGSTKDDIARIVKQANRRKSLCKTVATMRQIERTLKTDAAIFGEQLYALNRIGLIVRLGICNGYVVTFGVDPLRRIVIVKSINQLSKAL